MGTRRYGSAEAMAELAEAIRSGDVRAVARAISLLEDSPSSAGKLIAALSKHYEKKPRLGITGSPGVGKSTLINQLIRIIRGRGQKVGVVAVDPTSPFSGGAILGDRIRMSGAQSDEGVYIRSMGSRGSMGGVSSATANAVRVLEVYGSDIVIIETVGMGQTGYDIVDIADCVVLLLSPESGDGIQTMKAGVMEIADIYVINKADRAGADGLASEIELLLSGVEDKLKWRPPVIKACALTGDGVGEILEVFYEHQNFLSSAGLLDERRLNQVINELRFIVENSIRAKTLQTEKFKELLKELAKEVIDGRVDTYSAAQIIITEMVERLRGES